MRLFSVISRILIGGFFPLCRGAVCVFYSSSRQCKKEVVHFCKDVVDVFYSPNQLGCRNTADHDTCNIYHSVILLCPFVVMSPLDYHDHLKIHWLYPMPKDKNPNKGRPMYYNKLHQLVSLQFTWRVPFLWNYSKVLVWVLVPIRFP